MTLRATQYCYRCGNQASILEVGENGQKKWNVFSAAPENDTDGPNQAAAQMAKVRFAPQHLVDWLRARLTVLHPFVPQAVQYFL